MADGCSGRWSGQAAARVTTPHFLIDENLSPALVRPAHERGFEAMHVNHLGLRTETDWVLVTNNAIEFRGRYREIELHPGVVFLLPAVRRPDQVRLFEAALDHVQADADMVNCALDVTFDPNQNPVVTRYSLP